jgi:regulator of sigma E protease
MLLTGIAFILILSILVFVHELGHFLVARWVGVRVDEFGFGLPPRIWGKKVKQTIYSINALPIGGFVKLAGEDADETEEASQRKRVSRAKLGQYFWARTKLERAAILLAGVTMNFLLAVGITSILVSRGIIEQAPRVHVETVTQGSPAAQAGLKPQDILKTVAFIEGGIRREIPIAVPDTLISTVKSHAGEPVSITYTRDGHDAAVTLTPRKNPPAGQGPLGVAVSNLERKHYPWYQIPAKSVEVAAVRSWQMISSLGNLVYRLATGRTVRSDEVSGPVGIAQVTGQAVRYGWEAVLEFMSILSLNLAILNVLPFPALDGGRLLFVVLEGFGKKARPDVERTVHQIGMVVLLALVVLITINDILRIVHG